ncbi:MAG: hypothetical protein J0L78_14315 [Planctomycetes bacterium]|nr:hypothetical protein [Planctomycetota bacterium]
MRTTTKISLNFERLLVAQAVLFLAACQPRPHPADPPDCSRAPLGYYAPPHEANPSSRTAQVVGVRVATGGLLLDVVTDAKDRKPLNIAWLNARSGQVQARDSTGARIALYRFIPSFAGIGVVNCTMPPDARLSVAHPEWTILTVPVRSRQFEAGDQISLRFIPDPPRRGAEDIVVLPTEWTEFTLAPNMPLQTPQER